MERFTLREILNNLRYIRDSPEDEIEVDVLLQKNEFPLIVTIIASHEIQTCYNDTDTDTDSFDSDSDDDGIVYEFNINISIGNIQKSFHEYDEEDDIIEMTEEYIWNTLTYDGVIPIYINSRMSNRKINKELRSIV